LSGSSPRGAIVYTSGMEEQTISRQFSPDEKGMLLEYVLDSVWTVADELTIVFKNEPDYNMIEAISPFGAKVLSVPKGEKPVAAIFSAFQSSKSEHCILVTERIPLLKPNVVLALFEAAQGFDLAIPKCQNGSLEPLLAVYRRNALLRLSSTLDVPLEEDVAAAMKTVSDRLFDVKYVSVDQELRELDPELDSFFNVNDNASLAEARLKASVKGSKLKKAD
jgi:molybdenum cofactor guanylyltransferase